MIGRYALPTLMSGEQVNHSSLRSYVHSWLAGSFPNSADFSHFVGLDEEAPPIAVPASPCNAQNSKRADKGRSFGHEFGGSHVIKSLCERHVGLLIKK